MYQKNNQTLAAECNSFTRVRIVLVGTTHPGNIGATARAMKTMSQQQLYLVSPRRFPDADATARAAGADDLLTKAKVVDSLAEALADCSLVFASSTRNRTITWPSVTPRVCAEQIMRRPTANVAIVFGRESSGLSNDELELCDAMIQIPTNPVYRSLNLAQAVQIICYEILKANISSKKEPSDLCEGEQLVTHAQMQMFYQHLALCMEKVEFFDPKKPRRLIRRMKRLFNRIQLEQNEYNILRGFLCSILDKKDKG